MPAAHCHVDLAIAPAQLRGPPALPDLDGTDDSALLRNHVAVAGQYHALADQLHALLCSLADQRGITLNGAEPLKPAGCESTAARPAATTR
ncbi:hypothetical protein ACODUL_06450 [Stenotrophomonas maltophilia]